MVMLVPASEAAGLPSRSISLTRTARVSGSRYALNGVETVAPPSVVASTRPVTSPY